MSSSITTPAVSPFTQAVVNAMRKLYPESLADKSFDNTGLLLEAPFDPLHRQNNSVLLTIDLTRAVATEAIENKHSIIIAYHPIIFRGLKSLTLADPQQSSLLRLAREGISVYCPHTAVDAVPGGMADWLCDMVTGTLQEAHPEQQSGSISSAASIPIPPRQPADRGVDDDAQSNANNTQKSNLQPKASDDVFTDRPPTTTTTTTTTTTDRTSMKRAYSKPFYPSSPSDSNSTPTPPPINPSPLPHTRSVIHPSPISSIQQSCNPSAFPPSRTGSGRLLHLDPPQPLTHLIERIATAVGTPKGFPVAIPQGDRVEDVLIRTVAVCPGSGAAVLRDCGADLIFTGELGHHDALAVVERGGCVVVLFHTNSERGFLGAVMRGSLLGEGGVGGEWARLRTELLSEGRRGEGKAEGLVAEEWEEVLADESFTVDMSAVDRDPYGMVVLEGSQVEGMKL